MSNSNLRFLKDFLLEELTQKESLAVVCKHTPILLALHQELLMECKQHLFPETRTHPETQRKFSDILSLVPKSITYTHSPYILDSFKYEQVCAICEKDEWFYIANFKNMPNHEENTISSLSTGQLWDVEGEEWVINFIENFSPSKTI